MTGLALRMQGVEKRYGTQRALQGVSFEVPTRSITGFVGPNGAGKTTCFGVIAGLLRHDAGDVEVLGGGVFRPGRHGGELGLLPQDAMLPAHSRVDSLLHYWAELGGLNRRAARAAAAEALELVALQDRARSRIRELSHGMRRRVAVAQALLGRPRLVLLDEPTAGLDPDLVVQMRQMLLRAREAMGCAMLISSHMLSDLESICDRVVMLEGGQVREQGSLDEVTGRARSIRYRLDGPINLPALTARLSGMRCEALENDWLRVHVEPEHGVTGTNARVLPVLLDMGAGVLEVHTGDSLESAYMARYGARDRSVR